MSYFKRLVFIFSFTDKISFFVLFIMTLNLLEIEKNSLYKQGVRATDIPPFLLKILPQFKLLQRTNQPGVYLLYFPNESKIYIGQSKKVSWEISMYLTFNRKQVIVNNYIRSNSNNVYAYAIFQGPALADNNFRYELEKTLIQKTIQHNINSVSTARHALIPPSSFALAGFLKTEIIQGSLVKYGLKYTGSIPPRNESCIYLFLNPQTLNFYIGETRNFYEAKVMKRHKTTIFGFLTRQQQQEKIKSDLVTEKVIKDLSQKTDFLLFTCLENLDQVDKKTRVQIETQYKQEAFQLYPNRLYNQQNFLTRPGLFSKTQESKEKNRKASLTQDITMDTTAYPCICENKWYNSRADASRAYGYKTNDGLKYKLADPAALDFIWLKDTKGKPLPKDPKIQKKVQEFFNNLKIKQKRIIKRDRS